MGVEIDGLTQYVRSLETTGIAVSDLKAAFSSISDLARGYAVQFAPSRTGKLRKSVKGSKTKSKAVVRAGSARIRYAGAINYGDRKRHIAPSHYLQRADAKIRPRVIPLLEDAIGTIIREQGLQ
jgi:hypothetical protein